MADLKQKRSKELKYLRDTGRSVFVPAGPSVARVRDLHDNGGMTLQAIADAARLTLGAIGQLHRGSRNGTHRLVNVYRTTEEALCGITPPKPQTIDIRTRVDRGPRVKVHGARRRLNALTHEGFPISWITDRYLGTRRDNVSLLFVNNGFVHSTLMNRIKHAYSELEGRAPDDFDVPKPIQKFTHIYAIRREAAPRHCWDEETLDDPDAIAEWTGHCGTQQGYYIHQRKDQPRFWAPYVPGGKNGRLVVGCTPCRKVGNA